MLLSPRHSKKGNLAAATSARHRPFCLGGEREQRALHAGRVLHSLAPTKGPPQHRSVQHPPSRDLPARLERAPPFQRETPTGMQTVQAHLTQTSLWRISKAPGRQRGAWGAIGSLTGPSVPPNLPGSPHLPAQHTPQEKGVSEGSVSPMRLLIKNKQRVFTISQLLILQSASCAHWYGN